MNIDVLATKKVGNQIIENANDLSSYAKELINIIDKIDMAWDGDDSLKYVNMMKEKCVSELEELNDFVSKYGEYLASTPEAYAVLDEAFSSKTINV